MMQRETRRGGSIMGIIDISVPLYEGMPVWPQSPGIRHEWVKRIDRGNNSNDSVLHCDVHLGTHIDAPFHFCENGRMVEELSLEVLCGSVYVADLTLVDAIGEDDLSFIELPDDTERLLFKTSNSKLWKEGKFNPKYVALTKGGAQWIVDRGIQLVGIDYLSIGSYHDSSPTHRVLLGAEVVIVEGLNLTNVQPGRYELVCLPMKFTGAEGAPARVILRTY